MTRPFPALIFFASAWAEEAGDWANYAHTEKKASGFYCPLALFLRTPEAFQN